MLTLMLGDFKLFIFNLNMWKSMKRTNSTKINWTRTKPPSTCQTISLEDNIR